MKVVEYVKKVLVTPVFFDFDFLGKKILSISIVNTPLLECQVVNWKPF